VGQIKIDASNIADSLLQGFVVPKIISIVYPAGTATDPAGGETITIKGTGFQYGATVKIAGVAVGVTTVIDFNTITFTAPAKTAGNYALSVLNSDGGLGTSASDLVYSTAPTWSTASGSLGSSYESQTLRTNLSANSDSAITYSLSSGTLPAGATLASNGLLSGTLSNVNNATTYSFTLAATDAESQSSTRSFSYVVNSDIVTFSTANNLTMNVTVNTAVTSNTIVASAASGQTVTFSSSSLPTGITINATSGVITGTPTVLGNTASIITATANTTNKSANITFNFAVTPFVPTNINISLLAVAGGGSGAGFGPGGGGGAGGMVVNNSISLATTTTYTVVVGAGGVAYQAENKDDRQASRPGSNTVFSGTGLTTVTAIGGGGGSSYGTNPPYGPSSGGSGGGGSGKLGYTSPADGTAGQGNNGGNGSSPSGNDGGGGGGGGAGAVGSAGSSQSGGAGGVGLQNNFRTGSNVYYAGGGGGGAYNNGGGTGGSGGNGGGGAGARTGSATNGSVNTGGGGGGTGDAFGNGTPGNGGSGIVVITYAGSPAFTGGTVTTVGSNTVHTFTSSGSLVPV
jgi:hypothetical protein